MEEQNSEINGQQSESGAATAKPPTPDPQPPTPDIDPDSRRVRIVRVEHEHGPATCISYADGASNAMAQWYPDPAKNEFEVKAVIAVAAINSGYFAEAPTTRTRLKAVDKK